MVTSIRQDQLADLAARSGLCTVHVNDRLIGPIRSTFADVEKGEPVAFVGSCGYVEIAVNQGNAVERFGPADRAQVDIRCESKHGQEGRRRP
jgi:S-adenosylmethionine hydrolase